MQINDKALLVKLSIGMPGNSRKDKPLTAEVTANHSLAANAGRWNKTLYPAEAFEPLVTLSGSARTFHYENTLPWLDDGMRILPTLNYENYTKAMRDFRSKFESLADSHFIQQLTHWEAKARSMHNGTFRQEDYLPAHKLTKKFKFVTGCQPIPTSDDFRVKFSDGEMQLLRSDMSAQLDKAILNAESDLWHRLADPLSHLSAKLADPDAKFKDSILGNLSQICELIPKLNLTQDKRLAGFASEVQSRLAGLVPDKLRHQSSDRNAARLAADQILAKMSAYMPEATNE